MADSFIFCLLFLQRVVKGVLLYCFFPLLSEVRVPRPSGTSGLGARGYMLDVGAWRFGAKGLRRADRNSRAGNIYDTRMLNHISSAWFFGVFIFSNSAFGDSACCVLYLCFCAVRNLVCSSTKQQQQPQPPLRAAARSVLLHRSDELNKEGAATSCALLPGRSRRRPRGELGSGGRTGASSACPPR